VAAKYIFLVKYSHSLSHCGRKRENITLAANWHLPVNLMNGL